MDRVANEPCHGWTASSLYLICVMEGKTTFREIWEISFSASSSTSHSAKFFHWIITANWRRVQCRLDWCLRTAAGGWTLNKSPMTLDTLICVRKVVIKPAIIGPDVPLFTDESSENCRVLMTDFHSTLSRVALGWGAARCDNSDRQFYKCTTQQAATS